MDKYVVDTNVLLSADNAEIAKFASHLTIDCRSRALRWLQSLPVRRAMILLDDHGLILQEYKRKIQHGDVAYEFLRTAFSACLFEWVHIECGDDGAVVLPEELDAIIHDPSDRKFIAVALACSPRPRIVNVADTDWLAWETGLRRFGICLWHLCRNELRSFARNG